jgi:hypothetical protein
MLGLTLQHFEYLCRFYVYEIDEIHGDFYSAPGR